MSDVVNDQYLVKHVRNAQGMHFYLAECNKT